MRVYIHVHVRASTDDRCIKFQKAHLLHVLLVLIPNLGETITVPAQAHSHEHMI